MANEIEPFYKELGKRVQGFRKRANLTQANLGSCLYPPLTRASVANIENGKQRVLAHTAVDIAKALGVRLEELLSVARDSKKAPQLSGALEEELATKLSITREAARTMATRINGSVRAR